MPSQGYGRRGESSRTGWWSAHLAEKANSICVDHSRHPIVATLEDVDGYRPRSTEEAKLSLSKEAPLLENSHQVPAHVWRVQP